jgi:predicted transcriptional regulator of viral defense system
MVELAEDSSRRKSDIAALSRASVGSLITTVAASRVLGLSARMTSDRLSRLARGGWLTRVRRGLYFIVPLDARSGATTTVEDPWILGTILFAPCYIGGWSAAEHWGLTEQIFRSTFIATAANVRRRTETFMGAAFHIVKVNAARLEGATSVWRGATRVAVSGRERTLVDAAADPRWIGGTRHLADVIAAYRDSREADPRLLATTLERYGTGAAAKRLGFLVEQLWPDAGEVAARAHAMRTTGAIALDPQVRRRGRLSTRWGLWVNVPVDSARASA